MKLLVQRGVMRCGHDGVIANITSQEWVRVVSSPVLVEPDPQGRSISLCPNISVNFKPCQNTLAVRSGYSTFIRIDGQSVCLDSVVGFTDGTPPGAVDYTVRDAGQLLVGSTS